MSALVLELDAHNSQARPSPTIERLCTGIEKRARDPTGPPLRAYLPRGIARWQHQPVSIQLWPCNRKSV